MFVGRPTRWGNPFVVDDDCDVAISGQMYGPTVGEYDPNDVRSYHLPIPPEHLTADLAVYLYRDDLESTLAAEDVYYDTIREALKELRGKDLACWCALDAPCHADVLLDLANR